MANLFSQTAGSDDFFELAKRIYQGDDHWIVEDEMNIRQQFDLNTSYFDHCQAKVFLACQDNDSSIAARLVGFFNPKLVIENEQVAYFGYWETLDDLEINQVLFQQFERWARDLGVSQVYGPINFSTYQKNRLRLDTFEQGAYIDEPYNPVYYPKLIKDLGYSIKHSYTSAINQHSLNLAKQVKPIHAELLKQVEGRFTLERLNAATWMASLEQLYPLIDSIFSNNFAYTPISWDSFKASCGLPFANKLCPKSSVLVRDYAGDIAGFFIGFPDYSGLINQGAVSNLSGSDLSFVDHGHVIKSPKTLLAKTCGVAPKYRSEKLFPLMTMQLCIWGSENYQHIAGATMRDDNASMGYHTQLVANGNKDFVLRRYGLFGKSIKSNIDKLGASK